MVDDKTYFYWSINGEFMLNVQHQDKVGILGVQHMLQYIMRLNSRGGVSNYNSANTKDQEMIHNPLQVNAKEGS